MKIARRSRWLAALGAVLAWVAVPCPAGAGEEAGKGSSGEAGEAQPESEGQGERDEDTGMVALDLVLGWGKVPFAVQNLPAAGNPAVTYSRSDATESNVQTLMLGGSLELTGHAGIGARLPFTFAGFEPDGSPSRSTTSFGNLELEGEYSVPIAHGLHVIGALGVALPTAEGDEIPAGLANANAESVNTSQFDRWSLNKAAAYARGYEDNALFEPHRLGLVPRIGASYHLRGLSIEPYVKIENLIATSSALEESYVGELVAALRVGYWVHRRFQIAVKGWVNVGFAGTSDDKTTAASLEPQLVLKLGPFRPYAGVIIPLAGPPKDNGFDGLRLGVAAAL